MTATSRVMLPEISRSGPPQWSDRALQDAAQRCANAYARVANLLYGCNFELPVNVSFKLQDRKPKAAGAASIDMELSLNMILYRDNVQAFLNDIIPHEVGHLIQFVKFDLKGFQTRGHGPEWREAMRRLGCKARSGHDLDISKSLAHYKSLNKKKKVVKKVEA